MNAQPFVILIAEDNATDVMIMREALASAKVRVDLHVVSDGVAALEFLRRMGGYALAPRPDLILLDLNMPRKNGHEVLAEVKADESLRQIPVVMFTTSQADEDVARAYAHHVNCYIRKPMDFERFSEVVRSIETFWFTIVTLPHARIND
jgi:chemotaxis family two-component system response regulator Rcp1